MKDSDLLWGFIIGAGVVTLGLFMLPKPARAQPVLQPTGTEPDPDDVVRPDDWGFAEATLRDSGQVVDDEGNVRASWRVYEMWELPATGGPFIAAYQGVGGKGSRMLIETLDAAREHAQSGAMGVAG